MELDNKQVDVDLGNPTTNTWMHLALVFTSSPMQLNGYRDGVLFPGREEESSPNGAELGNGTVVVGRACIGETVRLGSKCETDQRLLTRSCLCSDSHSNNPNLLSLAMLVLAWLKLDYLALCMTLKSSDQTEEIPLQFLFKRAPDRVFQCIILSRSDG